MTIYYTSLSEDDQLIQLLIFSWSTFAKSTSVLWNEIDFLHCFKYSFACRVDSSRCETSTIQCILFDFLLVLFNVNFLSSFWFETVLHSYIFRSFVIVKVVVMRFSDEKILLCFYWSHRLINSWRCLDILQKKQNDRSRCSRVVFWWFEYRIWKIHFAWVFRQDAQIFSIVLTFLICDYCYE